MGDVFVYAAGLIALAIVASMIVGMLVRALVAAFTALAHLVMAAGLAALFILFVTQLFK